MEHHSITTDNESNGILYEAAYDENDVLCFACDEDKTQKKQYVCPNCGRPMILRKSNNTGRYAKRPHFAHKSDDVQDCKAEGVLHQTFKNKLYELLNKHLEKNKPFNFESNCPFFKEHHSGNLLNNVKTVYIEKDLGICRPDILLTDVNDKPYIAVEIVVTHYPEENPIQYYKDNNIYLYQIDVQSFDDLKNIEEKAKHPDYFNYCTRPKCPTCDSYMKKREITIEEYLCGNCNKPVRKTKGYEDDRGSFEPYEYNSDELNFVINNSVALNLNYEYGRLERRCLDHTCPHCNPMDNQEVILKPLTTDTKTTYYCEKCGNGKKNNVKKCSNCNQQLSKRTINIYKSKCNICNTPITFAEGEDKDALYYEDSILQPYQFTQEQIDYANQFGTNIIQIKSKLYSEPFYANVCPKCGNFGNNGLYNVDSRMIASKEFAFCESCEPYMPFLSYNHHEEYCKICGKEIITRTLFIVEAYCYRCKKPMKVAFIKENDGSFSFKFNSFHKARASRYGIVFKENEEKPMACPHCNAPISERYIEKYTSCKEFIAIPSSFCPYKKIKEIQTTPTINSHNSDNVVIFDYFCNSHAWGEYMNYKRKSIEKYDIITLNNVNNYILLIQEQKLNNYNHIYLWLSNDEEGERASAAIYDAYPFETNNMTAQFIPQNYKDFSEYLSVLLPNH